MPAKSASFSSSSPSFRPRNSSRQDASAAGTDKFLVAIDFGTTFSYVAYMNVADPSNENIVSKWDNVQEKPVPTVLKYENGGTSGLFQWGHGASRSLMPGERLHEWFKLGLHREAQESLAAESDFMHMYPSSTALPPVEGEDCERLVIHYLKRLSNAVDEYLADNLFRGESVPVEKEYIMTIPAMWSDRAKQTTARCAQRALKLAGDDEGKLQFITEPEAAGIYALTNMRNTGLRQGDTCVICDAGGGTVDLSSYRVLSLKPTVSLLQVARASGGLCGSSFLNRIFEDYLKKRLQGHVKKWGAREMRWLKSSVDKWFEQEVKPHFDGSDDGYFCRETDALGENTGIPNNMIRISGKDIREKIFDPVVERIQVLVRDQITLTVNQGETVTAVLLAGGFGNNAYLRTCLERMCKDSSVFVHAIHESALAIVRGALIYGRAKAFKKRRADAIAAGKVSQETDYKDEFDPGIIMADVPAKLSPAHFGVIRYVTYDPKKHLGNHDFRRDSSGATMIPVMEWFVHQGTELREDEPKFFKLRWLKEAKRGKQDRLEIVSEVFAYEGKHPPDYPDSPLHPSPDIARPLATLKIVFKDGLPKHQRNGSFWYDERFEINMVQGSAKTSFFLLHNGQKHDVQEVTFAK
ncbi:Heat shock protein Hsp70 [Metarhizium album ARSEF 1941]|uniref:Heat shock protein Hsp70 n=1 Tax=Metarhizium album (strain ARSEF 1941) TaxID=1081103 RepID=A0A0B2X2B3_METAS|nr:Heat shock protein Hsp70 [Metarhizium album ARSEF 1941]KHO00399.1 Heat shock protein Hsp70 [Metarhizium album ARSEF 1941]